MTEEQAFIEWKAEQYKHQSTEEELEFVEHLHYFPKYFKKTFLDGYHECQKEHEWHDLEKDPTDLPKEEREYIVMNANEGGDTSYWICYYWKEEKKFTGYGLGEANVIKWKEIE